MSAEVPRAGLEKAPPTLHKTLRQGCPFRGKAEEGSELKPSACRSRSATGLPRRTLYRVLGTGWIPNPALRGSILGRDASTRHGRFKQRTLRTLLPCADL